MSPELTGKVLKPIARMGRFALDQAKIRYEVLVGDVSEDGWTPTELERRWRKVIMVPDRAAEAQVDDQGTAALAHAATDAWLSDEIGDVEYREALHRAE